MFSLQRLALAAEHKRRKNIPGFDKVFVELDYNMLGKRRGRPLVLAPPRKRTKYSMAVKRKNPYVYNTKVTTKFKRTVWAANSFTTDTVNPTLNAVNFSMNDVPGYTELTAAFTWYRVTGIAFHINPEQTESNSTGAVNNNGNVPYFVAVNRQDSSAPASVNAVLERNDHEIVQPFDHYRKYFKPAFQDATSAMRDGWVSTANPSLNWYGMWVAMPPTVAATDYWYYWTVYLECKDPK